MKNKKSVDGMRPEDSERIDGIFILRYKDTLLYNSFYNTYSLRNGVRDDDTCNSWVLCAIFNRCHISNIIFPNNSFMKSFEKFKAGGELLN